MMGTWFIALLDLKIGLGLSILLQGAISLEEILYLAESGIVRLI